jgi:hypothetical protein
VVGTPGLRKEVLGWGWERLIIKPATTPPTKSETPTLPPFHSPAGASGGALPTGVKATHLLLPPTCVALGNPSGLQSDPDPSRVSSALLGSPPL